MSNTDSLELIADELYEIIKDLKTQPYDLYVLEAANDVMKKYEQIKSSEDPFTPLLPGYENSFNKQESLFEWKQAS